MVNNFTNLSTATHEGKTIYQRHYVREKRAQGLGFKSYKEYFEWRLANKGLNYAEQKLITLEKRIAYLESENARLQKCLEVALCKKQ